VLAHIASLPRSENLSCVQGCIVDDGKIDKLEVMMRLGPNRSKRSSRSNRRSPKNAMGVPARWSGREHGYLRAETWLFFTQLRRPMKPHSAPLLHNNSWKAPLPVHRRCIGAPQNGFILFLEGKIHV
jgi:hypothetical protein